MSYRPLTHFGARNDHGDAIVAGDLDIGVEGRLAIGEILLQRVFVGLPVFVVAEGHAAGDGGSADKKGAAGDFSDGCHGLQAPVCWPAAARLMAARMRG